MSDSAEYFRAQALICLGLAREMSDPEDKDRLKKEALDYTLRAERIEDREQRLKQHIAIGKWQGGKR